MNNLLYLSYGTGPHEQEVIFSVLSAHRWSDPENYRVLVYTDHPGSFRNSDMEVRYVSPEQWDNWAGPKQFNHRRKILALQDALRNCDGPVVLLDGDTWLKAPVERLFQRVGPGRSVMHIREGRVSKINKPHFFREMRQLLDTAWFKTRAGTPFQISADSSIWNAGVIGMDPADAELLNDVLDLTDQLCEQSRPHVLEQFAFSWVLQTRTALRGSSDLVFHYWLPYLYRPFRERLNGLLSKAGGLPKAERARFLYAHRPQTTWARRGKAVLQRCGVIRGRCRSSPW